MAHPKHLVTAYDEAALQYREASAVLHRRIREGGVPTREDLERAAEAKETLEEAVRRLNRCGNSIGRNGTSREFRSGDDEVIPFTLGIE